MSLSQYLVGLACLGAELMGVGWATVALLRRCFSDLVGAPRWVAGGLLATAGIVLVHLLPGMLGMLSRAGVLLCVVALVLIVARTARGGPARPVGAGEAGMGGWRLPLALTPERPGWSRTVSAVVAAAGVSALVVCVLDFTLSQLSVALAAGDTLNFHLPGIARWIQSGSFWPIARFQPDLAPGNYPHNGDVVLLCVVLPFRNAAFARLAMVPMLGLTGLAVYSMARELGGRPSPAALFGAVLVAVPVVGGAALKDAIPDAVMLATFGGGLLFGLRHWRTSASSDLVLAGLGLGLAFGTKWYAVSSVVVVVVVWTVALLLARRPLVSIGRWLLTTTGLIALAGGFWLVRNLVESADPFYPVRVRVLGTTVFNAHPDLVRRLAGFSIADYFGAPSVLNRYVVPALTTTLGYTGWVLAGGLGVCAATILMTHRRRLRTLRSPDVSQSPDLSQAQAVLEPASGGSWSGRVVVLGLLAVALLVLYCFTPYTAFGPRGLPVQAGASTRYAVPGLLVAAALAAWAASRLNRLGVAFELLGLACLLDGVRRSFDGRAHDAALLGALLGVIGVLALLCHPGRAVVAARLTALRRAPLLLPTAIGLGVVVVAFGFYVQRRLNDKPYRGADATLAWVLDHADTGHRIALTGNWSLAGLSPVAPAFGPFFGNSVTYLGPVVGHMQLQYSDGRSFTSALARGRYDLVLIGRGYPVPGEHVREEDWAAAAGFQPVARSDRLSLLQRGSAP